MKVTLQVKLLADAPQREALLKTMAVFNEACNFIAEVAFRERCASKFALQKLVYADVRAQFGLSAQLAIRAIAKVVEAYKRDKRIQPHFRATGAVVYDQRILRFKGVDSVSLTVLDGRLSIPIQMGQYQRVQFGRGHGQADLVLVDDTFYLLVVVETPEAPPMEPSGVIGIDLGISRLATDSDGEFFSGAPVEATRARYARLRQALQARGTRSATRHLQRLSCREARFRRNNNHIIAKRLVAKAKQSARAIAMEDLVGLRERTKVRKAQRAKHHGWSYHQLRAFVLYKAAIAGVPVTLVDPAYTSQTCPACGNVERANRINQAQFRCIACGHTANADTNAAINIATRAALCDPVFQTRQGTLAVNGLRETYEHRPSLAGQPAQVAQRQDLARDDGAAPPLAASWPDVSTSPTGMRLGSEIRS